MLDSILSGIDVSSYIDSRIIILLLCIGFFVKHFMPYVSNKYIPFILMGISLVCAIYSPIVNKDIIDILLSAIVSGSVAIGLHTSGKGFLALFNTNSTPTPSEEEIEEIEEVEEDIELEEDYTEEDVEEED